VIDISYEYKPSGARKRQLEEMYAALAPDGGLAFSLFLVAIAVRRGIIQL
jgi:hypothetical protein